MVEEGTAAGLLEGRGAFARLFGGEGGLVHQRRGLGGSEHFHPNRKPGRSGQTGVRGKQRGVEDFGKRDVGRIVRGQVVSPGPYSRQYRSMRVPVQIEIAQIVDGVSNPIRRRDVGQFISPECIEDLDVHEFGPVQRELRIGDSRQNLHPGPGPEHEFDNRGGVQDRDHVDLTPLPLLPQHLARRWVELNGWQLGDSCEQLLARRLLE